jgi:hypothetical protein
MLHRILDLTLHDSAADGIASGTEKIIAHALTVVAEVTWCLAYRVGIRVMIQIQKVRRADERLATRHQIGVVLQATQSAQDDEESSVVFSVESLSLSGLKVSVSRRTPRKYVLAITFTLITAAVIVITVLRLLVG